MEKSRIKQLTLPPDLQALQMSALQAEQYNALRDLLHYSYFQPCNDDCGPYDVALTLEESKLVLRVSNARDEDLSTLVLSLKPYRRLIQDYFLIMESYEEARRNLVTSEKLEALDMGRRGLHNEGAELLQARLRSKIEMDLETARRFFSLICLLTQRTASVCF